MIDRLRNTAPIPLDWSDLEAAAVAAFLQEVLDSIWLVHGDAIERNLTAHQAVEYERALGEPAD